jgi:hypothetical protein
MRKLIYIPSKSQVPRSRLIVMWKPVDDPVSHDLTYDWRGDVLSSAGLNRSCKAIPTNVAIRIAG